MALSIFEFEKQIGKDVYISTSASLFFIKLIHLLCLLRLNIYLLRLDLKTAKQIMKNGIFFF